jgi:hypothetical protein
VRSWISHGGSVESAVTLLCSTLGIAAHDTVDRIEREMTEGPLLATVRWSETGETIRGNGWWGALIPRAVVERVGVPNAELFWWTEDAEYLQWRIPQAGFEVVWTKAPISEVSRGRPDATKPAWKYYYEARNQVFHRLHVQRPSTASMRGRIRTTSRSGCGRGVQRGQHAHSRSSSAKRRTWPEACVVAGHSTGSAAAWRYRVPDTAHRPSTRGSAPHRSGHRETGAVRDAARHRVG